MERQYPGDVSKLPSDWDRRRFLQATSAAAALAATLNADRSIASQETGKPPETLVKVLYDSLSPRQKEVVCFDWQHTTKDQGLLRTRVANNWKITQPTILSDFYTRDQQAIVRDIFLGIIHPDWHDRFDRQLKDDMGGFGVGQSLAIFGTPGSQHFEFVLTGRHTTLRCDGNTQEHVALGGPIFYGHAAGTDDESAKHPGNVFWEQALAANRVYNMLDGRQRKRAEVSESPDEEAVGFRDRGYPGIPISELAQDQKAELIQTLEKLIEPFRTTDREEVHQCLAKQGGIDRLHLAFYTDDDIGDDGVWDNWRLEGPSFVWYFRGAPHVHVWVNIADNPSIPLNA
ncbi:MAG: DUF3500 domain-containing protein [Planctomycetota bacterium]|jgi:hypothetical protein